MITRISAETGLTVTLFVRVWIEIILENIKDAGGKSHSLRESVD